MIYRTLHWYILREMLRIFLLTASALTTLMAFGGTFQPLVKRGLEITQLMTIMFCLMPAMLSYAIPIAALFAAVLVYWRMSTDNGLTACRAGGISFIAVILPAFLLGLVVASTDLVFANYVVPHFLQATERAAMRNLGAIVVSQVGRGEAFEYERLIVYANQATEKPGSRPGESIVVLDGAAMTPLGKDGKPSIIAVARQAVLVISDVPDTDSTQLEIQPVDVALFDPKTFKKITGSVGSLLPGGWKFMVPSLYKTKPKFLNLRQLLTLNGNPYIFPPVKESVNKLGQALRFQDIAENLQAEWKSQATAGKPLELTAHDVADPSVKEVLTIYAPQATMTAAHELQFSSVPGTLVRVDEVRNGTLINAYSCSTVVLELSADEFLSGAVTGALQLSKDATKHDYVHSTGKFTVGAMPLTGIDISPTLSPSTASMEPLVVYARGQTEAPNNPAVRGSYDDANRKIQELFQYIDSELNSRGSFSLSCLTLVLLGAALGILMRGRNPLAVFVLGFVPAIVLVLLITAGRQLTEGNARNVPVGIAIIWLGNLILLMMVGVVYGKLLRQ